MTMLVDRAQSQLRSTVDRIVRVHGGSTVTRFRRLAEGELAEEEPVRRPAVVAVQLALALEWDRALTSGQLASRQAIAQETGLTRARITQLIDLTLLAPDIQEQVLFLEAVDGAEPLGEHTLRAVLHAGTWDKQRAAWRALTAQHPENMSKSCAVA